MPYKPGHPMYIRIQREKALYEHAIETIQAQYLHHDVTSFGQFAPLYIESQRRVIAALEYKLQQACQKEHSQQPKRSGSSWMRHRPLEGFTVGHADRFGNHIWLHPQGALRLSGVYSKDVYLETFQTCTDRWGRSWQSLPWLYIPAIRETDKQHLFEKIQTEATSNTLKDIDENDLTTFVDSLERIHDSFPKEHHLTTLNEDQRQAALDILSLYEAHSFLSHHFDEELFLPAMQKRLGKLPHKAQQTLQSDMVYLMCELDVTAYHLLVRFLLPASEHQWMFPKGISSSLQSTVTSTP